MRSVKLTQIRAVDRPALLVDLSRAKREARGAYDLHSLADAFVSLQYPFFCFNTAAFWVDLVDNRSGLSRSAARGRGRGAWRGVALLLLLVLMFLTDQTTGKRIVGSLRFLDQDQISDG